jgi:CDP-diacylglycerol--glycerol-3-phosphate 3-phosphatidyltransferase
MGAAEPPERSGMEVGKARKAGETEHLAAGEHGRAPTPEGEHRYHSSVQKTTDELVRRALLWVIPHWIQPNWITLLRFPLTAAVILALHYQVRWLGLVLFIVAISTDFIDGAMARTRNQISRFGVIVDPIADKALIGIVLGYVGWHFLVVKVIVILIVVETIMVALGAVVSIRTHRLFSSNAFGKLKMVLQSIGLLLFLVGRIWDPDQKPGPLQTLVTVAVIMLWGALALAVVSGLWQGRKVASRRPPKGEPEQASP